MPSFAPSSPRADASESLLKFIRRWSPRPQAKRGCVRYIVDPRPGRRRRRYPGRAIDARSKTAKGAAVTASWRAAQAPPLGILIVFFGTPEEPMSAVVV